MQLLRDVRMDIVGRNGVELLEDGGWDLQLFGWLLWVLCQQGILNYLYTLFLMFSISFLTAIDCLLPSSSILSSSSISLLASSPHLPPQTLTSTTLLTILLIMPSLAPLSLPQSKLASSSLPSSTIILAASDQMIEYSCWRALALSLRSGMYGFIDFNSLNTSSFFCFQAGGRLFSIPLQLYLSPQGKSIVSKQYYLSWLGQFDSQLAPITPPSWAPHQQTPHHQTKHTPYPSHYRPQLPNSSSPSRYSP